MVREGRVERQGRSLRYLEAGAGWPLVLLHAFPLNADMWRPILERVPEGSRYIAPDLRGLGGSTADAAATTMDDHASDVEALLDAFELDRAAIGGLSMGGYVAFALLRRAPERISALVLADTRAGADSPEGKQGRRAMSELVRTRGAAAVADQMLPGLLAGTDAARRAEVRAWIEANGVEGIDAAIHAMLGRPDSMPDVQRAGVPVLVIVGEQDVITPVAESERMHDALTRSQLVVVPGAGHLSAVDAPEAFAAALENFLRMNI